uniref:RNA binding motif protein 18 n=1 Tax=Salmo trutta TaxID=8032 RepID=A0A673X593_SALTR
MESAVESSPIVTENKDITLPEVESASIVSEKSLSHEGHRLWIGNIDPKITEWREVGKVKQFDFLFHKSGPMEGQPRGHCFVSFHTKEVQHQTNHFPSLSISKRLKVPRSSVQTMVHKYKHHGTTQPSYLTLSLPLSPVQSMSVTICAIEAKLQMMENPDGEEYQAHSAYMYNKPPEKKRLQPYSRPFRNFRR